MTRTGLGGTREGGGGGGDVIYPKGGNERSIRLSSPTQA